MLELYGIGEADEKILLQYPFITSACAGKYDLRAFLSSLSAFESEFKKRGVTDFAIQALRQGAKVLCAHKRVSRHHDLFDLHKSVLAYSMLYEDETAATTYTKNAQGTKVLTKRISSKAEFDKLVEVFKQSPFRKLAFLRNCMFTIRRDPQLSENDRIERVKRYLEPYFSLMCELDAAAFPSTGNKVYFGIPYYVPDNLSDMGSSSHVHVAQRSGREKINLRKIRVFHQAKELYELLFTHDIVDKGQIARNVASWVYRKLPYDHKRMAVNLGKDSINLDHILSDTASAVCRHHALYAQTILQSFGIVCHLLKCDVQYYEGARGGRHACNLIRLDGQWYIFDATSPINSPDKPGGFIAALFPIPQKEIDLTARYVWQVIAGDNVRTYERSATMYYRIK